MPTITLETDNPESHRCATCCHPDRKVSIVVGYHMFCGQRCADHHAARSMVAVVSRAVQEGRGGSPNALDAARTLLEHLQRLEPVHEDEHRCPRCWLSMLPMGRDGEYRCSTIHKEVDSDGLARCPNCGFGAILDKAAHGGFVVLCDDLCGVQTKPAESSEAAVALWNSGTFWGDDEETP